MDIEALKGQLKSKNIGKLYLFYGPEEFLKDYYVGEIEKQIIKDDFKSMNITVIDRKIDIRALEDVCETLPMLSERRLVIVKNSGLFKKSKKDIDSTGNQNGRNLSLDGYLVGLPDYLCLIFIESEVDKRLKTFNVFKKGNSDVEFPYQNTNMLVNWVANIVKSNGKTIDKSTAVKLVEFGESGMRGIYSELQKLILYCSDQTAITSEDVDAVCTKSVKESIFDFTDALVMKKPEKAFRLLNDMIFSKEPITKILFMISRQFRNILKVKIYQKEGVTSINEMLSKTAIRSPYELGKTKKLAERLGINNLKEILEECLKTDISVKTGKVAERVAMEILISKLTS